MILNPIVTSRNFNTAPVVKVVTTKILIANSANKKAANNAIISKATKMIIFETLLKKIFFCFIFLSNLKLLSKHFE